MARVSYFICTAPQCGSVELADLLEAVGLRRPEEYFNPTSVLKSAVTSHSAHTTFIERVLAAGTDVNGVFGAIIRRQHFANLQRELETISASSTPIKSFERTLGEVRYVYLRRGNKYAQAVQWYRSILAQESAVSLETSAIEEEYDGARLSELLRLVQQYDLEWLDFFRNRGVEPLILDFEDLLFDARSVLPKISEHLGVPLDSTRSLPTTAVTEYSDGEFDWIRRLTKRPISSSDRSFAKTADALNRKAAAEFAQGDAAKAEQIFQRALLWDPLSHGILHNYAVSLAAQSKRDRAITYFGRALAVSPKAADTHRNLGLAYAQSGRSTEAEAGYRKAVEFSPESAELHYELAQFLRSQRRWEEAAGAYRNVVRLRPDHADANYGLGICHFELRQPDEAETAYRDALRARPNFPEVQNNLGVLYEERGDSKKAIKAYQAALAERPNWPEALNNYGVVLAGTGEFEAAERHYRSALEMAPDSAGVLNNLGNALRAQGKLDEAISVLRRACELKPHYSEAYNNLGIALMNRGLPNEAIAHYNQALYFVPDYPEPHLNRSLAWLSLSDFDNGWVEYEWRWRGKHFGARSYSAPRWDGEESPGRTIFLYAEQGMGDTLQFIRYAALAKQRGATVIAQVQTALLPILKTFPYVDRWLGSNDPVPEQFDAHAPMMSLPGVFKTTAATIPAQIPYLSADASLIAKWRDRLASLDGLRIGISWQGNPDYRGDRMRSISLNYFASLADVPGVRLISLQKQHGLEQLGEFQDRIYVPEGLDEEAGPFMDTAAIMKNLDLVIASDSAVVHLAGALGVPTWVAIPFAADWRWFRNRDDSPWYPTMRLFRQPAVGNWDDVFSRIVDALRTRTTGKPEVRATKPVLTCDLPAFQQGTSLAKAGNLHDAETSFRTALSQDPDSAVVAHNLGVVLALQGRISDAAELFERAIQCAPEYGEAHGNLGLACLELGDAGRAIREFRAALRHGAPGAPMHNNIGAALMDSGRPREAVAAYRQSLLLNPNFAEAHLNLARSLLALGSYEEGWLEYEWRRRSRGFHVRKLPQPVWAGEPLLGKTILLHDDAPVDDFIQFLRYAAFIRRRGGRVVVSCPEVWAPLIRRFSGVDAVVPQDESLPRCDVQAVLSGLPWLFKTSLTSVPGDFPYLDLPIDARRRCADFFSARRGLKVALVRPAFERARGTADFASLHELLRESGVDLIRLPAWSESGEPEARPWPVRSSEDLVRALPTTSDPLNLAAWMSAADVVITADGPECHLAGACDTRCFLVLDAVCNWRWMTDGDRSPWYPRTKIFRRRAQASPDWPFAEIIAEVRRLVQ